MARMVSRTRMNDGVGFGMKLSENIVIIALVLGLAAGVYYYFNVYRRSPGFALGEYLGAIKSGNVKKQYDLIDEEDKQFFPTLKEYEKNARQARGYTTRITNVSMKEAKINPKNPKVATIEATVSMRDTAAGKELYQVGETKSYKNQFTLRKDSSGDWKVWLARSADKMEMLTATPNPPVTPF